MRAWLLYPPFADPTQPYLSLPYLKGALRATGQNATVLDLNVEAAHYLLGRDYIHAGAEAIAERFEQLNQRSQLNRLEQMEYLTLAEARPAARLLLAAKVSAQEILQDSSRFYDIRQYRQARTLIENAFLCIGATAFPYRFHYNQAAHLAVPWGVELLKDYFRNRRSPLTSFYDRYFTPDLIQPGDLVGINLTFISQLPEAFYLAQYLRQRIPALFIILGGSCLQQILAQADEATRRWIVTIADAVCAFEGELALSELLTVLSIENLGKNLGESPGGSPENKNNLDEYRHFARLSQVPNLLLREPGSTRLHAGPLCIADLKQQPAPDYSDLNLDRYLAPERTLLFAPTRGCYWNHCAFCDYGMSRSACHGYREMDAEVAAAQLRRLSQQHDVRNFYISVDAMAPPFSVALAQALIAGKTQVRWSADFRIENDYTEEHCALLYRAGLRAAAFGVESGSDRMLQRMAKGLTVKRIRSITHRFHRAGIAVAWMTFSEHPGENARSAMETVRLIAEEQATVDLFILGRFGLTSGSRIAADPNKYGLQSIYYCKGDDFRLFPLFEARRTLSAREAAHLEEEVAALSQTCYLDHYPWCGAISTHHSFLYFLRYGQRAFREMGKHAYENPLIPVKKSQAKSLLKRLSIRPAFPLNRLRLATDHLLEKFWRQALRAGNNQSAPLDESFFLDFFQR